VELAVFEKKRYDAVRFGLIVDAKRAKVVTVRGLCGYKTARNKERFTNWYVERILQALTKTTQTLFLK